LGAKNFEPLLILNNYLHKKIFCLQKRCHLVRSK